MKISGLEEVTKQLDDAQTAMHELDGTLGTISFDPNDPESIALAIKTMERIIDERLGRYGNNAIIAPLIESMKESYRIGILNNAASDRIETEK